MTMTAPRPVTAPAVGLSVPVTAAQVLLATEPGLLEIALAAVVEVGSALEVDLHAVPDPLSDRLAAYWSATRRCWDRLGDGDRVDGILVRVPLVEARQSDTAGGRKDLREELSAIEALASLQALAGLFDKEPEWENLTSAGIEIERDGACASARMETTHGLWPLCLGGPARPGELSRVISVRANYAPWRDRRSRRLTDVRVEAVEVWPDPAGF